MFNNLIGVISLLCALIFTTGATLVCQDGSYPAYNFSRCVCDDDYLYNALEGECQDVCNYYGSTICEYGDNGKCANYDEDPLSYSCECSDGYQLQTSGSQNETACVDVDECNIGVADCMADNNQVCLNLDGGFTCVCNDASLISDDGLCDLIDLCHQPTGPYCDQICNYESDEGYVCSCFYGFTWDGERCQLDDEFENCTCKENPDSTICVKTSNGTQSCSPKPGFQFNDNNKLEDIDECSTGDYQCPSKSDCVNNNGWYSCECWPNYEWDSTLRECVHITCPEGYGYYDESCYNLCDPIVFPYCAEDMKCMTDGTVATCECQVICQLRRDLKLNTQSTIYIYGLSFIYIEDVPEKYTSQTQEYFITKSVEQIFGKGNAEIVEISSSSPRMYVQLAVALSQLEEPQDIEDVVSSLCWALKSEIPGTEATACVLPGGISIIQDSIHGSYISMCSASDQICNAFHGFCNTVSQVYWCSCLNGFQEISYAEEFYCEDINECVNENICGQYSYCVNSEGSFSCEYYGDEIHQLENEVERLDTFLNAAEHDLEDQEKKTKVVGGVLGAFFGLTVLFLIGGVLFVYRMK